MSDKQTADDGLPSIAEVRGILKDYPSDCIWELDDPEDDTWGTQCGHYFSLNEGTPTDNRMAFCCYCGKPIREIQNVES